jgi:hypothetical protein
MNRVLLWITVLMFLGGGFAYAGDYTDSAHGNSGYGVDRADPFPDYAIGNCANCHEQHASIDGTEPAPAGGAPSGFCLLADNFDTTATTGTYTQDDDACFYCHTSTGYLQHGGITNNDYSTTFGNGSGSVTGIMQAFNLTSYHNLNDVLNFAKGEWSSTFTDNSNPCSVCHNVHIAQRSCGKPNGSYDPTQAAISKPSDHNNLWGNDAGERMNVDTSSYQAPYWSSSTYFEPFSTNITTNGSNLPDYVSFCTDCHDADNVIASTTLGVNLKTIDWSTTGGETGGDKHGKNIATDTSGANISLSAPYLGAWTASGLVLACTDCHEPHGAPSVMLIRGAVNGGAVSGITSMSTTAWVNLCARCHNISLGAVSRNIHHENTGAPYLGPPFQCARCHGAGGTPPIPCYNCHYHGADDSWVTTRGSSAVSGRRTF